MISGEGSRYFSHCSKMSAPSKIELFVGVQRCGWKWADRHSEFSCVLRDIFYGQRLRNGQSELIELGPYVVLGRLLGSCVHVCVCVCVFWVRGSVKSREIYSENGIWRYSQWPSGCIPWSQAWISNGLRIVIRRFLGHGNMRTRTNDLPARSILPTTYACFKG